VGGTKAAQPALLPTWGRSADRPTNAAVRSIATRYPDVENRYRTPGAARPEVESDSEALAGLAMSRSTWGASHVWLTIGPGDQAPLEEYPTQAPAILWLSTLGASKGCGHRDAPGLLPLASYRTVGALADLHQPS